MTSLAQVHRVALAQDRMLKAIERQGDGVIRRYAMGLRDAALEALRRGEKVKLGKDYVDSVSAELTDLMMLGFVKRYAMESRQTGVNLSFAADVRRIAQGFDLNLGSIRDSFEGFSQGKVRESAATLRTRINGALADITSRRLSERAATRAFVRRLDEMGLSARNPSLAQTLVRTHSQLAFNAAQWKIAQDDEDDIIWGYRYVTMGDDRVRPEHEKLDGMVRKKDDPVWDRLWPPNGWNCRCQVVALTSAERQTPVPAGVEADPGFGFNPGEELI